MIILRPASQYHDLIYTLLSSHLRLQSSQQPITATNDSALHQKCRRRHNVSGRVFPASQQQRRPKSAVAEEMSLKLLLDFQLNSFFARSVLCRSKHNPNLHSHQQHSRGRRRRCLQNFRTTNPIHPI